MSENPMEEVKSYPDEGYPKYLWITFENREWTFSPNVRRKAQEFISDRRIYVADSPLSFYVHSSTSIRVYVVRLGKDPETNKLQWTTCGCSHGSRQGWGRARCSHVLGVLLALKTKMELPTRLSPEGEKILKDRLAREAKK